MFGIPSQNKTKSPVFEDKVANLSNVVGHFDGKRAILREEVGPYPTNLLAGTDYTGNSHLFNLVTQGNGSLTVEDGYNDTSRPGIRLFVPDAAPVAQAPYTSFTMRPNVGPADTSWSIGFVYSYQDSENSSVFLEFISNDFDITFRSHSNGVIIPIATGNKNVTPTGTNISGGAVTQITTFNPGPIFFFVLSFEAGLGFKWRCINLDTLDQPTYDNDQDGYMPPTWSDSYVDCDSEGIFYIGRDANFSPNSADIDLMIHECFYVPYSLTTEQMEIELTGHFRKKWFELK